MATARNATGDINQREALEKTVKKVEANVEQHGKSNKTLAIESQALRREMEALAKQIHTCATEYEDMLKEVQEWPSNKAGLEKRCEEDYAKIKREIELQWHHKFNDLDDIKMQIKEHKQDYEKRIKGYEDHVQQVEDAMNRLYTTIEVKVESGSCGNGDSFVKVPIKNYGGMTQREVLYSEINHKM